MGELAAIDSLAREPSGHVVRLYSAACFEDACDDPIELVDRVVAAAREAGAARVVVVGPAHAGTRADRVVREDPPFSGPLAALAAALEEAQSFRVMLLACDLMHPASVTKQLVGNIDHVHGRSDGASDGIVLVDESGHAQWLASLIDRRSLVRAVTHHAAEHGTLENESLGSVLQTLKLERITAQPGSTDDIDTPEQLHRAQELN